MPDSLPMQYRAFSVRAEDSAEDGGVPLSFSSDRPIQRQYYGGLWWNEILGHAKGEVNTERLQQGLNQAALRTAMLGKANVSVELRPIDADGEENTTGNFAITSWKEAAPNSGLQAIDITMKSRGAISFGTVDIP